MIVRLLDIQSINVTSCASMWTMSYQMTITRFELGIYRNETRNFIAHDDPIPTMETNKASTHFHFA